MMERMIGWSSERLQYPPMVFSVIRSTADSLELKAITEVPSAKGIHPISFRFILIPGKRIYHFRASEFYFEDIRLSLEAWFEKYEQADTARRKRNLELISQGIESHIFLSMNDLAELIDKK